jgi:hypothetical protein
MNGETMSVLDSDTETLKMDVCCQCGVHSDPSGIKLIYYAKLASYYVRGVKTK